MIHFLQGSLAQPQMMVLTDVEEVFVPIVDGFLVSIDESRPMLETLVNFTLHGNVNGNSVHIKY